MSSFYCEKCGKAIVDTPRGYKTCCSHYTPKKLEKISGRKYQGREVKDER